MNKFALAFALVALFAIGIVIGTHVTQPDEVTNETNVANTANDMTPAAGDDMQEEDDVDHSDGDTTATMEEAIVEEAIEDAQSDTDEDTTANDNNNSEIDVYSPQDPFSVQYAMSERSLGAADAPVVFYDFSSLSCPHCASFHNDILPRIKSKYIDPGYVRVVFRPMPLNETALMGEKIARCVPKDQYIKVINLLFKNQDRWAFNPNARESLISLVKLAGVDPDRAKACLNDNVLETALIDSARADTNKYNIRATPTFIFEEGERKLSGTGVFSQYDDVLSLLVEQETGTEILTEKEKN